MSTPNSPCAACKFLRRKCTQECVFAPYFPPDQPQKFANVHKVFGASNVSKLLNELSTANREDAVNSLAYEAEARLRDPVYGCVGLISVLQHRLKDLQNDLYSAKEQLAQYIGPQAMLPAQLQTVPAYLTPQQHNLLGNPSGSLMLHNNALPLIGSSSGQELGGASSSGQGQQFLIGDSDQQRRFQAAQQQQQQQHQQQVFQAQRLAAEQQEMMARAYEQKPDQMFNRDFQVTVASNSNQMSPSLGLGNFDSSNYNIQPQQLDHHHNQINQITNPAAHQEQQLQAELFLQPQIQPLQISQPRPSGSTDDGGGPVGSSC